MRNLRCVAILSIAGILFCRCSTASASDAPSKLPGSLRTQLRVQQKHLHLPTACAESDPETSCVSVGDFDGNGSNDYAIVVQNDRSKKVEVFVALALPSGRWSLTLLRTYDSEFLQRVYVDTLVPGSYNRTESAGDEIEDGEVSTLESRNPGVAVGLDESSEIGYFFVNGIWKHVWIAD
jgi:hypothetical protein